MKKKNFLVSAFAILGISMLAVSCKKEERTTNSTTQNSPDQGYVTMSSGPDWPGPPPPGKKWELHYKYDGFNFHRPVKDCLKGFWFCFIGGGWEWELVPATQMSTATINGTIANLYAYPLANNKLEVHFPLALTTTEGYNSGDLSNLNVDDAMNVGNGYKMVKGTYPVTQTSTDLVVIVDVTN